MTADAQPEPEPIESSTDEIPLGSAAEPAREAEVQPGLTEPVPGLEALPTLTLLEPATDLFTTAGVTWALDPGVVDVVVKLRVKDSAGVWGAWSDVELSDPNAGNREAARGAQLRGGTEPVWTNDAYGAEVELLTRSGVAPTDVRLILIDPRQSPADTIPEPDAPADTANADAWQPPIYSRQQWGADESIRTWDPEYASTLKAATVHHTADSNDYTPADVPQILRSIYSYHAVSRGWGDIGYNFVVDKFGRIWEGRFGGIASTVIGAHAGGFNSYTTGVSMLGNYDEAQPTYEILNSVAAVIAWKFSLYQIYPMHRTTLVSGGGGTAKYPEGTPVELPVIFGHRDVGSTVCPGRHAYAYMDWMRERTLQHMQAGPTERLQQLRNDPGPGPAEATYGYGPAYGTTLACDFNGDRRDDLAVFDRGIWSIRYTIGRGPADLVFAYGGVTWRPVCGDWNGDGVDGIGVFDGSNWYLRDTASPGSPTVAQFSYGWYEATPVVGDWNGDGISTIGVWDPTTGNWWVRNSNNSGSASTILQYGFSGAIPVPADYNGDGWTDVGVYASGYWYLRNSFSAGSPDRLFGFGNWWEMPLTGNWDAVGGDGIGTSRPERV
ncbi:MAG: N-acetylmuramoyl-L-alanine amidase [Actinomycetota bacterium]|nr:N-acetylmuramoyl-L-alanine amidase [Actinomycetota bacterium]